jgi:hypothetical protein
MHGSMVHPLYSSIMPGEFQTQVGQHAVSARCHEVSLEDVFPDVVLGTLCWKVGVGILPGADLSTVSSHPHVA